MKYELELAQSYFKLLTRLDWSDKLLIAGLREGLGRFLSNAVLGMPAPSWASASGDTMALGTVLPAIGWVRTLDAMNDSIRSHS